MAHLLCPVAVHLFLRDGVRILLSRRFQTGYEDGNYSLVAGHVETGEDVVSAMIREAAEEVGITIDPADCKAVQVMHRKTADGERIDWFFECSRWCGDVRNAEPDKCDELWWAPADNLPANTVGYIAAAIVRYQQGAYFTLYGWDVSEA